LLLVVGLIFLIGYLMRRVGPLAPQGGQHIRLLSSLPLGPRDRIMLVDVGGKQLLLGASPGRINTLHVFDEPIAEVSAAGTMNSDFAKTLRGLLKREPKS
ncbi:MAG: flagellar biosynthetic protein FliO, partial [Pseudomonas sp.]|nr:flagellar biosynthetic protein FliO [Pseudomonas sp.]